MRRIGPGSLDAPLKGHSRLRGRVTECCLLLTDGLKLADKLQVENGASVYCTMFGGSARRGVTRTEGRAVPVLHGRPAGRALVCPCVALGASVEGVGGGISHLEHGVWVVTGVRRLQFREEFCFDDVAEIAVFVPMDMLWEGSVRHR